MTTPTITAEPASSASPFLTETQAGERLGFSGKTLRNWRSAGSGPPFLRLGSGVRYHVEAVDSWALGKLAA